MLVSIHHIIVILVDSRVVVGPKDEPQERPGGAFVLTGFALVANVLLARTTDKTTLFSTVSRTQLWHGLCTAQLVIEFGPCLIMFI